VHPHSTSVVVVAVVGVVGAVGPVLLGGRVLLVVHVVLLVPISSVAGVDVAPMEVAVVVRFAAHVVRVQVVGVPVETCCRNPPATVCVVSAPDGQRSVTRNHSPWLAITLSP